MAAPYSQDLRDRVLAAYDRGMDSEAIAKTFLVSTAWARAVRQRRRETGETSARPMGGATVIKIDREKLTQLVREQPDATLKELRSRLGVKCAVSAVSAALKRLGLSFKKRRSTRRNRIVPMSPSIAPTGRPISRAAAHAG